MNTDNIGLNRLGEVLKEKGISPYRLSQLIGMSQSAVQFWKKTKDSLRSAT